MSSGVRDGLALICVGVIGLLIAAVATNENVASVAQLVGLVLAIIGLGMIAFGLTRRT